MGDPDNRIIKSGVRSFSKRTNHELRHSHDHLQRITKTTGRHPDVKAMGRYVGGKKPSQLGGASLALSTNLRHDEGHQPNSYGSPFPGFPHRVPLSHSGSIETKYRLSIRKRKQSEGAASRPQSGESPRCSNFRRTSDHTIYIETC